MLGPAAFLPLPLPLPPPPPIQPRLIPPLPLLISSISALPALESQEDGDWLAETMQQHEGTTQDLQSASDLLTQASKVGACTGIAGAAFGGIAGLTRSNTPALFAAASSIQWFAMGSVYWGTRQTILNYQLSQAALTGGAVNWQHLSPSQRCEASAIAGGTTGFLTAAITRGRSNVIPGTLIFALVAYVGQRAYNSLDQEQLDRTESKNSETLLIRMAKSRFSPMKVLTSQEYADMLREKHLRIEAEIALVDDEIARLQKEAQASSSSSTSLEKG